MDGFTKRDIIVRDIRVQVLEAGGGAPIVYFHGAGSIGGFDDLLPLGEHCRLIIPIHPGFGASDDDPAIDSMLDYVVHYANLFDHLGLTEPVDLIGHSLGGWIATMFTVLQGHRVRRLALACPAGLRMPDHPTMDLFLVPADKVASLLVADPATLERLMPGGVTNEMKVMRYREMTSLAHVAWSRNYDPKLERWLDRVNVPTLLLWGEQDRVIPVEQTRYWAERLGHPEIATFPGAGHLLFAEARGAVGRVISFLNGQGAAHA
ncbi:MAG: alpha/beta fold hydrolase [Rhizobiales bacterium]|nr:alpha/beta fold hydrolase [Hyphomicrobiales bacterium]